LSLERAENPGLKQLNKSLSELQITRRRLDEAADVNAGGRMLVLQDVRGFENEFVDLGMFVDADQADTVTIKLFEEKADKAGFKADAVIDVTFDPTNKPGDDNSFSFEADRVAKLRFKGKEKFVGSYKLDVTAVGLKNGINSTSKGSMIVTLLPSRIKKNDGANGAEQAVDPDHPTLLMPAKSNIFKAGVEGISAGKLTLVIQDPKKRLFGLGTIHIILDESEALNLTPEVGIDDLKNKSFSYILQEGKKLFEDPNKKLMFFVQILGPDKKPILAADKKSKNKFGIQLIAEPAKK
jgi:hypothetical protein